MDLPLESIASIIATAPDFHHVYAIIRTSKAFHLAWEHHHNSICHSVLFNCEPYLHGAIQLARVEEQHLGLAKNERRRIYEACYSVWTAVVLAGPSSKAGGELDLITGFFDREPLRSLLHWAEFAHWMRRFVDHKRLIDLQVTMLGACMLGKEDMSRVWENAMEKIFERWAERYERVVSSGE
ncbi:MAG: hypothetical protein Q9210_000038 [Variospora velana]